MLCKKSLMNINKHYERTKQTKISVVKFYRIFVQDDVIDKINTNFFVVFLQNM